jgi:hypothetical protein
MSRIRCLPPLVLFVSGIAAAGLAHAASFRVTTPADSGAGSLRQAIADANANPGFDGISFAIDPAVSGPGPWTIALRSPLPPIKGRIAMSGFSQPGSRPGFPAQPLIEIDIAGMACNANNDFGSALTLVRGAERSLVSGLAFVGNSAGCGGAAMLVLADGVKVVANRFGVRANGDVVGLGGVSAALGVLMSRDSVIGDPDPDNGNIFAGIASIALAIDGTNHTVQHNWFGSNGMGEAVGGSTIGHAGVLTGSIALNVPRAYRSVYPIQTQRDSFGLRDSGIVDNHFVAVDYDGIYLHGGAPGPDTSGNSIARNLFGTNVWGLPAFGTGTAIRLEDGTRDTVVADNAIRNGNAGIVFAPRSSNPSSTPAGTGNRLSRNVFLDLNSTAIALTTQSPLANDPLDADEGPNRLQNRPELTSANTAGLLEGSLHSMPGRTYTIEVFLSAACTSSGGDVADMFLQSFDVTTDGQGDAGFAQVLNQPPFGRLQDGDVLTATATDTDGNTSELSACVSVADLLPVALTLPRYPLRMAAMDGTLDIAVDVAGNGPVPPTGSVVFTVVDPNRRSRELGRAPVVNGRASLPPPPQGALPQGGRYTIEARYEGDARYAPNAVSSGTLFVFRPPTALLQFDQSAPVRHDLVSDAREWLDLGTQQWMPLGMGVFDAYIDADRFDGLATDQALVRKGGVYYTVDAGGRMTPRSSGVLGNGEILDLIQVDGDIEADALVRDPATRRYAIVQCLFQRDRCEAITPLDVNPELEWRGSGDFDGDGRTDLVFQQPGSTNATILLMDDGKPRGSVGVRMPDLPRGQIATADVDGDGFDDLLWTDPAGTLVEVELFQYGRPSGHAQGSLRATGWSLPGAVYTSKAGMPDFGSAQLLLDNSAGDATFWTGLSIGSGTLTGSFQLIFGNVDFALERTR